MDKPMRRSDRQLTDEETLQLFRDAEYGVLSVSRRVRLSPRCSGSAMFIRRCFTVLPVRNRSLMQNVLWRNP